MSHHLRRFGGLFGSGLNGFTGGRVVGFTSPGADGASGSVLLIHTPSSSLMAWSALMAASRFSRVGSS